MLHDLYTDSRFILCPHVQEQALFASDIITRGIMSEDFCADHFCLVVRDVHVGLCVDDLEGAHCSPIATTISTCRGSQEIWLGREGTIVSGQTLCAGPFVCHAARESCAYAREWSEWEEDGDKTAEAVGQ